MAHNCFFLVYLYLLISTCFGLIWAHHQEIQLCLCDTWYLFLCMDECLVCIPDTHPYTKKTTIVHQVGLFKRLYRDARSIKHKNSITAISPWRYTTHSGCVLYSPLSGFSLLAYEVT